jgi:iron-sulfur cluster repair protein YtfE (RIC family)
MASPKMALGKVNIQSEHQELMQRLSELDTALDELVCYSEVYANLSGAGRVQQTGQWLAGWLPTHFVREEDSPFPAAAKLGPAMAAFTCVMKLQHKEIGTRLQAFCEVADQLETTSDIEQSITALKDQGKELTNFVAAHMGAEERKLAAVQY